MRLHLIAPSVLLATAAWAGPTAHVGKELTKGVGDEVKKEAQAIDLQKGARQISSGMVEGVSEHGRDIDRAARELGRVMAQGFFLELRTQLGPDGEGPLAKSMAGAGEHSSGAVVHGVAQELSQYMPACHSTNRAECMDELVRRYAYVGSLAAAKGAADGAPPWPSIFIGAGGFAGGLFCSALIALLLGQRRERRRVGALNPRTAWHEAPIGCAPPVRRMQDTLRMPDDNKPNAPDEELPPDPAYTGLPAKDGGGKETEFEKYADHDS
jgi:hypothetical protein